MLDAVKKYAARVMMLHLALLILVVFFVLGAARQVRDSAREQAQEQSKQRLQLLADLSARGVDQIYGPIISNLDAYLREEPTTATAPATLPATTGPASPFAARNGRSNRNLGGFGGGGGGRNGRGGFLGTMDPQQVVVTQQNFSTLWKQLNGSVSQVFLVDANSGIVTAAYPENSQQSATALAKDNGTWLKTVKDGVHMSTLLLTKANAQGEQNGYHLIAVPVGRVGQGMQAPPAFGGQPLGSLGPDITIQVAFPGGPPPGSNAGPAGGTPPGGRGGFGGGGGGGGFGGPGGAGGPRDPNDPNVRGGRNGAGAPPPTPYVVVVVVPIDNVRDKFLDLFDNAAASGTNYNATLVSRDGIVLVSNRFTTGANLFDAIQGPTADNLRALVPNGSDRTAIAPIVLNASFKVVNGSESISFPPQIVAAASVAVSLGRNWVVLISSPLSDADTVVNHVFGQALLWAVFVTLSVTAILVSTSYFMIKSRVRLERTRHEVLTRELEQARNIQLAWLPDLKSVPRGLEVSAANLPASHISGDFYNWFVLPPARGEVSDGSPAKIAVVIGDVTGHGMAAAFLMATTQLLVRMTLSRYQDTARCLREVNQQLCTQAGGGFKGQFVTMLVMLLDPVTNTVQIATAGHPTPLIETSEGVFESLEMEPQLVLGVNHGEEYSSQTFALDPGASVILYTDGVIEAEAADGQQYGVGRLISLLQAQASKTDSATIEPATRIRAILEDVKRFADNRELLDDVTLVALRTSNVPAAVH